MSGETVQSIYSATLVFSIVLTVIFSAIIYVLNSLGTMKCMQKAGEKGWKAWVPFYNSIVMYKIVGLTPWLVTVSVVRSAIAIITLVVTFATLPEMYEDIEKVANATYSSSYSNSSYYNSSYRYSNSTNKHSYRNDELDKDLNKIKVKYKTKTGIAAIVELIDVLLGIGVFVIGIFYAIYIRKAYGLSGGYIAGMILVPTIFIMIIGFGKSQYVGDYKPADADNIV